MFFFQGQVEFLNSVIVDLHRKNDDLRVRLEVFENDVTGLSNGIDSGAGGDGPDTRALAPRLFCDICDEVRCDDGQAETGISVFELVQSILNEL
jgi:hypothetical protein